MGTLHNAEAIYCRRVFLSSTNLNGKFTLRIAVHSFRTHLDTIDLTLEILRERVIEM
ncbi:MAG: hypothetical protein ACHQQQ_03500 [Bacteroidota bacterium]